MEICAGGLFVFGETEAEILIWRISENETEENKLY